MDQGWTGFKLHLPHGLPTYHDSGENAGKLGPRAQVAKQVNPGAPWGVAKVCGVKTGMTVYALSYASKSCIRKTTNYTPSTT
jgi:hypothetical protein